MAKIEKTDEQWASELDPEVFRVARQGGTEPPFSGEYYYHHASGMYCCACCNAELFSSEAKYDSGSGWPSFYEIAAAENIRTREDVTLGMRRIEILCARCDAHLGHVFPDGPAPTGLRFCVNSRSLKFLAESDDA